MQPSISNLSKALVAITALMLIISIFVPIWRIELDAPQYPEGLMMQIYSYKLGGQVEIINGLNHYIGMQTLHAENFIEFTVLPYIIGAYALLMLITAWIAKKRWLYFSFWAFLAFGVIAMIDFWRWNYNYGHNLDPNAAIIVPGMSYQPPLIGFKQLLNFGAYSIPDIGGWLFVAGGILMVLAVLIESGIMDKLLRKKKATTTLKLFLLALLISSCHDGSPEPIKLNQDKCSYCSMAISDSKFGAEIITQKGRIYKFDDIQCMFGFQKEKETEVAAFFVHDYSMHNQLIDATKSYFIKSEELRSPMGGNVAAFENQDTAQKYSEKYNASTQNWIEMLNSQK